MSALRFRATNVLLGLVLLALVTVIAMLATGVRGGPLDPAGTPGSTPGVRLPGTPISQANIPMTITQPGHYYLTGNVAGVGGVAAITINTPWVSLDLGGFHITGGNTPGSVGVASGAANAQVTISNGTIDNFPIGIDLGTTSRAHVHDVIVRNASNRGINLGGQSRLERCIVENGAGEGIWVEGTLTTISNCQVGNQGLNGVVLFGGNNIVEDSEFFNNSTNNSVNDTASIRSLGNGNVVRGNNIIQLDFDIYITGADTLVKDNSALCTFVVKDATGTTDYFGNDCLVTTP